LNARSHEPEISGLLKICDIRNVPIATNLITAEAILHLMAEHPEALSGQHLAAQYLEEIADHHE
jgi:methylglyoxal synthase